MTEEYLMNFYHLTSIGQYRILIDSSLRNEICSVKFAF